MKLPKLLGRLLQLTQESKTPTDRFLDAKIEELQFYLPYVTSLLKHIVKWKIKRFFKYRYKRYLYILSIFTVLVIGTYVTITRVVEPYINEKLKPRTISIEKTIFDPELKTFDEFIDAVGFRESTNTWDTVNQYGMLGYFQFNESTLKSIGISVSRSDFLSNKELQTGAFIQLLKENRKTYQKYITKYNYRKINGVDGRITESGILMAFHLKPKDAIAFFNSGGIYKGTGDGNGTSVQHYIEKFSGYDLPF